MLDRVRVASKFPDVKAPMQLSDFLASFGHDFIRKLRLLSSSMAYLRGADACSANWNGDQHVRLQTRQVWRWITGSPSDRISRGMTRTSQVTGPSSSYVPWCNTSPDSTPPSPLLFEKLSGEIDIAFTKFRTLGIRNGYSFRSHVPTAHTLACLRFADPVTEIVARLTTGSGSTRRRRLLPLAGRDSHPLDDKSKFQGDITSSYPNRPAGPGRTKRPTPFPSDSRLPHPRR